MVDDDGDGGPGKARGKRRQGAPVDEAPRVPAERRDGAGHPLEDIEVGGARRTGAARPPDVARYA